MDWDYNLQHLLNNIIDLISVELLSAIAWPVAVVIIFVVVKKDILEIIYSILPRLDELRYKEWSAKLRDLSSERNEIAKNNTVESSAKHDKSNLHRELDKIHKERIKGLMEIAKLSP